MSEALITTWGEQVWPDLPEVSGNYRFGGNERHINPNCEQHNSRPCNSFNFFWYFCFTKEHSRSNHRKFELKQVKDVACGIFWRLWKIWKKTLGGENSNFRGEFGDSKIVEPTVGEDRRIQKLFLIDSILIYRMSKLEFVCESYGCFTNGLRIRGQNGPEVGKICGGG